MCLELRPVPLKRVNVQKSHKVASTVYQCHRDLDAEPNTGSYFHSNMFGSVYGRLFICAYVEYTHTWHILSQLSLYFPYFRREGSLLT